jgi:hypothetical protein
MVVGISILSRVPQVFPSANGCCSTFLLFELGMILFSLDSHVPAPMVLGVSIFLYLDFVTPSANGG